MSHFAFIAILLFALCSCSEEQVSQKPNVLFIAVDDLRPELNLYGSSHIKSPNIDRLASEGLAFTHAYCNVPVCGASRASLLTGIKPTRNRYVQYHTYAQNDVPEAISLPEHFKNNGYVTISNGKIFHHRDDIPESWSEPAWHPKSADGLWQNYISEENRALTQTTENKRAWPYEWPLVEDSAYFDGKIANKTIRDLRRLKDTGEPFFIAAGFLKPHLPFNAPQKYWDLYPAETIALPDNYYRPENVPDVAIHNFGELRKYYGVPEKGPVSDEMALTLIRGYYACVSYTDAQIGRLLDALDELDMRKNTIVILWGDHGWQLGEHTMWCKHSNFDVAMRVPMIISAPGFEQGQVTDALAEYIDIFPTLSELAGLEDLPQWQGRSFVPLLNNPDQKFKDVIYSRYVDGESIISDNYLYTEYFDKDNNYVGRMLYDHSTDPNENVNISEMPQHARW
ncbi:MAG: sulfatase [Cyclobacteriaceae bacterium]|nr:sulfatase [Cyclobacteriaceae bacterium]